MKKIIIIVANPNEDSFSFAIAKRYEDICIEKNYKVEIIDLYRDVNQQDFLSFKKEDMNKKTKEMSYYQEKISNANEIVFVFPFWWGSMPAILKNFFDWNFSADFAFKYVNSKPIGLLKDKKVKIFVTTGAPYFYYFFTGAHRRMKNMFKQQVIEFCGMKLEKFSIYGGIDTNNKKTSKILQNIR